MDIQAVPGKLKLKKGGVTKKKKVVKPVASAPTDDEPKTSSANDEPDKDMVIIKPPTMTKAEMAFQKRQAELQAKRIMEKAQKSHREKVEAFNTKMNEMTEFNDIPKVSWTK